jgi:hypothetical protein
MRPLPLYTGAAATGLSGTFIRIALLDAFPPLDRTV